MSDFSEDTKPVRAGEELSEENLTVFLRSQLNTDGAIDIKQFPGGSSNLTYLVRLGADEFVLRRPPFGNQVKTAHDMSREFRVLSALSKIYSPAPKPLLYCNDESVTGAEFYLMERKQGVILRGENTPEELSTDFDLQRRVCNSLIDNLALLHTLDYKSVGLETLGKPEGYMTRQVKGWTERYFKAKTDEWRELEDAIEWLNANIPDETNTRTALVHNDYKFDNVMLAPDDLTRIVGVLDWEMCTIGNPLMDLGTTLGYWASPDVPQAMLSLHANPRVLMENFTRRELAERYAEKTGEDISNLLFYYVFGTFKIAVIVQQIYFRFARGYTQDKRFAAYNQFVDVLGNIAARSIEKGDV